MRFGLLPAALILAVVFTADVRWMFDHPFGIHWDEAGYLNQVATDAQALRSGDPRAIARDIVYTDRGRPPAYRLVTAPAVALFGPSSALCRLLSFGLFAIAAILVYRTAALLGGPAAAAFAAVFVCLSPDVVAATVFLSTEPPLYLATAAMLWFLVRTWSTGSEPASGWIGLGLALGLGFLAKASFLMIATPVMALALFARPLGMARGPSRRWVLQAAALVSLSQSRGGRSICSSPPTSALAPGSSYDTRWAPPWHSRRCCGGSPPSPRAHWAFHSPSCFFSWCWRSFGAGGSRTRKC
jgi:4-amino-4-deoxy-L-arabinose transferase-like glycosyltransferase